ncbi:MAG: FkbM family methyltransferase [Rhodospirillaceae bacterium]
MGLFENISTSLLTYANRVGRLRIGDREARFYLPLTANFIVRDFRHLQKGEREPELYAWLRAMPGGSVLFDVGASYGQEAVYAGVLGHRVVAFNADPQGTYFLAVNAGLNDGADVTPVAALVGAEDGLRDVAFPSNRFYMRGKPKYWPIRLQIPQITLDGYVRRYGTIPTHLKIDVDGAETGVLKGAETLLANPVLQDIFIEVEETTQEECHAILEAAGFRQTGRHTRPNTDIPAANLIYTRRDSI